MNVFNNYYEDLGIFLYLIPLISAICFGFVLLIKPKRKLHQLYLAVFFIVLGIGMGLNMWYDRYFVEDRAEILRTINFIFSGFTATAALFYFVSLIEKEKLTKRYILYHFSGIIIFSIFLIISEYVFDWQEMITNLQVSKAHMIRLGELLCIIAFEIYICCTVIRLYICHKKKIYNTNQIIINIIIFILIAIIDLAWILNSNIQVKASINIVSVLLILFIFYMGYNFNFKIIESDNDNILETEEPDTSNKLKTQLLAYFEEQQPYLNPELNLKEMATVLKTNTTYLSRLINVEFRSNFYCFVNNYRINYAINLIKTNSRITNDTLYIKSGFKSRSAFYKVFKEKTGYTPQTYIQKT